MESIKGTPFDKLRVTEKKKIPREGRWTGNDEEGTCSPKLVVSC